MLQSIGAGAFTFRNFAQSLHNIYNVTDQDGDGFLSLSEFDLAGKSESYAKGLIDAYDRNGDGKLSQSELIAGTLNALGGHTEKYAEDRDFLKYSRIINESNLFLITQSQSVDGSQDAPKA